MSAIEKICEYSGDYDAHLMYGYKDNRIQVNPKYRKLFNGKDFKFFRFLPNPDMWDMMDYCLYVPELQGNVEGFYYNWTYNEWGIVRRKLKKLLKCRELNEIRLPITFSDFQRFYQYYFESVYTDDWLTVDELMLLSEQFTEDTWLKIYEKIKK